MRRKTLWARVVAVVAAVVAAIATDWSVSGVSSFWDGHSMTAGIGSGLLLLAAGLFGIEAVIDRRDERRWRVAARVAFKELGFNADELRRGMRMLLVGDYGSRFDVPFDAQTRAQLVRILARHPELDEAEDELGRLRVLLADVEWARLAVEGLDELKHRHRRALALWTPVLMTSERLAELAGDVAEANEKVFELQEPLRLLAQRRGVAETPAAAVELWRETSRGLVALQEHLMREADQVGWRHDGAREQLDPADVQALDLGAAATTA